MTKLTTVKEIIEYVSDQVIEKHKTFLKDQFDNGAFWAMKELQILLLKSIIEPEEQESTMIKFITKEPDESEKLTFDMVEDNQFFVDYDGYLCQKVHERSFCLIANPDNQPFQVILNAKLICPSIESYHALLQ